MAQRQVAGVLVGMKAKATSKSKVKSLEDLSEEIHAVQRAIAGLRKQVSELDSKDEDALK